MRTVDTADSGGIAKTYDVGGGGSIVALIDTREQSAGHGPSPHAVASTKTKSQNCQRRGAEGRISVHCVRLCAESGL